jgi:hypothetical protein
VYAWTQDDGALNCGPAHLIQTEEYMKAPILSFASSSTKENLATLFSLYTAADIEDRVVCYESSQKKDNPEESVHYFRLSQILRDLLFTCSSIDFGYYVAKHAKSSVRLYALNQSMLTLLWKQAGMGYVGMNHGSGELYPFPFSCFVAFRLPIKQ